MWTTWPEWVFRFSILLQRMNRYSLWVALDFIDVVVHLFVPDAREFYDVDNLWEDAEITDVPDID